MTTDPDPPPTDPTTTDPTTTDPDPMTTVSDPFVLKDIYAQRLIYEENPIFLLE